MTYWRRSDQFDQRRQLIIYGVVIPALVVIVLVLAAVVLA